MHSSPAQDTSTRDASSAPAPRILICDALAPEALEVIAGYGIEAEVRTGLAEDELAAAVGEVEALLVRSATKITRRVLEAAPRLRVVGRAGVGVDNVDLKAASERGVLVTNAPSGNTTTTAELAIALLCALARHVPRADRAVRAGQWKKKSGLMGTEIADKTLGVIGLGRIGRVVAERGRGLAMHVIAHDPFLTGHKSPVEGVELVTLEALLERSDFVTLHVPLTPDTQHLLDAARIARLKHGARVINCARGGLIDETALLAALEEGRVRGAALDVFEVEPPPADHPLLAREDVILTPHLGASSDEAQRNVAIDIAREVCEFLTEGVAPNAVNAPPLSKRTRRVLGPYLELAEVLGRLCAQRSRSPLTSLELFLSGEIAEGDVGHVELALLSGVLGGARAGVNFVNARSLADARGLRLACATDDEEHFLISRVRVRARSSEGEWSVAGTVHGREPRLVAVDGHHVDLSARGPLLMTTHTDRPGVVGLIGTALGDHGVNIRRVELGPPRQGEPGVAFGFFTLYDDAPQAAVDAIAALEPIRRVELLRY
ncbi:MAG TPA: phosphoglycerate dehydrogenase [Planctomycetota bacterium]|nr:phosphoglycerate dehydrogenase [Planctomycetota bacterium]